VPVFGAQQVGCALELDLGIVEGGLGGVAQRHLLVDRGLVGPRASMVNSSWPSLTSSAVAELCVGRGSPGRRGRARSTLSKAAARPMNSAWADSGFSSAAWDQHGRRRLSLLRLLPRRSKPRRQA